MPRAAQWILQKPKQDLQAKLYNIFKDFFVPCVCYSLEPLLSLEFQDSLTTYVLARSLHHYKQITETLCYFLYCM